MTERGQELETYLSDGTYEIAGTYRRPVGDTVLMLRSRPPRQGGVCPSIWLSLRDPRDLALLFRLREGEDRKVPTVARSEAALAPLVRRLSPFTLVRGLFG